MGAIVDDGVGDIGAVIGGIAGEQGIRIIAAFDADGAFDDREVFAGAGEVGGAAQGSAGFELEFVQFDVLFEIERAEGAEAAEVVRAVVVGAVVVADDLDGGGGSGGVDQFGEGHAEGLGDAEGDREGWVGLFAFDLGDHGAAHAAAAGECFEGPVAFAPELAEAAAEAARDHVRGAGGVVWFRSLGGHGMRVDQASGRGGRPRLLRSAVARARASSMVSPRTVKWPILRPGLASRLP